LVFRILDASAFYAGIPFASSSKFYTTSLVFDEIKHIKKNHDALGVLLETKRLEIIDPENDFLESATKQAKKTGDFQELTKEDVSALGLGLQLKGAIITDDFAVSNVAKKLGLEAIPVMTSGIKNVGNWEYYCPACHKKFSDISDCPLCGTKLRRKLIKDSSHLILKK
jgi:endoribonuclease Nob1